MARQTNTMVTGKRMTASERVIAKAEKILRDPNSTRAEKSVAASALTQRPGKRKW